MAMTDHHHAIDDRSSAASRGADDLTVVAPDAELDMQTSPRLAERLGAAERHASRIEVDMARVTFMDSTALHVLLGAHHRGARHGRILRVTGCSERIRRVFEITDTTFLLGDARAADARPGGPGKRPLSGPRSTDRG